MENEPGNRVDPEDLGTRVGLEPGILRARSQSIEVMETAGSLVVVGVASGMYIPTYTCRLRSDD